MVLGVDVWDGSPVQLGAIYQRQTGVTYPLLLKGSRVGTAYGLINDHYALIDRQGVLRLRSTGFIGNLLETGPLRAALVALLAEEDPTAVIGARVGWGRLPPPAAFALSSTAAIGLPLRRTAGIF